MIEHTEVSGIFNVGSGMPRTFNDVAKIIFSTLKKECKIEYVDMPEGLKGQYQYHTKADISKLRTAGYNRPMTSLEDGVSLYIKDFLNTNDRYL
jgi:ADP-L-glycero-D-manno-heptose 6-epimerase